MKPDADSGFSMTLSDQVPRATLLILRLWVGLTWLRAGWNKLSLEEGFTEKLLDSIQRTCTLPCTTCQQCAEQA